MALTREQAKDLAESLGDVYTPEGDAGTISRLHTFTRSTSPLYGRGQCALVVGESVDDWVPIADLESSATLQQR